MLFWSVTLVGLAALSAMVVRIMITVGRLDEPGARSSHTAPTPKGGGVGIMAAFAVGLVLIAVAGAGVAGEGRMVAGLGAAACGLALVAFMDDIQDWPFSFKLAAQSVAAAVVIACGFQIDSITLPGLGLVRLGLLGVPVAACWIVAVTNAVNFMDGLNGLAAGVTLAACLTVTAFTWGGSEPLLPAASLVLAAGAAGFLPFNFPRARIFMGDVGSQPCGFILAALGLLAARPELGTGTLWLMPMLLSGLLFDVVLTLIRRAVRGARLTQAHREHLYHRAHQAGMPAAAVSAVHWGMAAWGGACASVAQQPSDVAFPAAVALLAAPQLAWFTYVTRRVRRAGLIF